MRRGLVTFRWRHLLVVEHEKYVLPESWIAAHIADRFEPLKIDISFRFIACVTAHTITLQYWEDRFFKFFSQLLKRKGFLR